MSLTAILCEVAIPYLYVPKIPGGEAVPISTYMSPKYDWAGLGAQKRTKKR